MNESNLPGFLAGLGIVGLIIALLTSLFWLWMLIDCVANNRLDGTQKIIWLLVIFFLHIVGAIVYFFAGRGGNKTLAG
ncbi:MAG TPA: PLD nuclease N-terminal domain-containing protein [Chthoniobacteraceae bacterium]|jgi:uncharacterized RDD family membrane protein YckC|nr:hypothetical protein [Chthoniobacter sp.]HEV7866566.1 PLD nuclease N-terminal domain-containing protein [Chthoniobacteraceae bacterium]